MPPYPSVSSRHASIGFNHDCRERDFAIEGVLAHALMEIDREMNRRLAKKASQQGECLGDASLRQGASTRARQFAKEAAAVDEQTKAVIGVAGVSAKYSVTTE